MIFCLFRCFHQTINKKHWMLPKNTFFLKKIINDVFFNIFRSINGILNKTPFYKYNICNWIKKKILPKKWLFQVFFSYFHLLVENKHYIYFLSLKLYKVSIFNLFGRLNTFCRKELFHVTIYFFYVKFHKLRFFSF